VTLHKDIYGAGVPSTMVPLWDLKEVGCLILARFSRGWDQMNVDEQRFCFCPRTTSNWPILLSGTWSPCIFR